MKLLDEQHAAAPGAGVLSVSLTETSDEKLKADKDPAAEQDELWNLIGEELANDGSPAWRMWR